MLQFEFINNPQQFLTLATAWKRLGRESATPYQFFQEWHWVSNWWKLLAPVGHYRLRILVATDGSDVVMIWPWVIKQNYGLRILEPLGGLMSCFDDALIVDTKDKQKILGQAWKYILKHSYVDAIEIRALHESANIASVVRLAGGKAVKSTVSPAVDMLAYDNFDAYLASRSKKMRQNQRRSLKYLGKLGEVRASGDDRDISVDDAIDVCLDFKSQWLEARGLSGKTLVTRDAIQFLKKVCRDYWENTQDAHTCISTLYLDEKLISVGIGFRYQNYHYEYLGGFDYQLERHGPGRLRMEQGIRDCFSKEISGYNMLTPATSFKKIWTNNTPLVEHFIIPVNVRGRLYRDLYMRKIRPGLKKSYKALPSFVRTKLLPGRIWG